MAQKISSNQDETYNESLRRASNTNGIIPFLEQEVAEYRQEIQAYRAGGREDAPFMAFRLHQGVYGQRQQESQMLRIKAPGGILTPEALEAIGKVVLRFSPNKKGHITTRENIQIHHLSLEDCADAMEIIGEAGLSSREACANTVRNVVAPPAAGVCPDEAFDVIPYLTAYVRFGVRNPLTQNFPRKFKTAFTGCPDHDNIMAGIQDLAFIAQEKQKNGSIQRGFKVIVGGGTSIMPRLGKVLYEFVSLEDYLRVAQAIWIVFDNAQTLRKNRMMARIKVLIDRVGFDSFKEMVEEELSHIGPIDPTPLMQVDKVYVETPHAIDGDGVKNLSTGQEFLDWKNTNVFSQRQDGYSVVTVTVPQGDIGVDQFFALANIIREFTGGTARASQEQNLVLRWVRDCDLTNVWNALKGIGLAEPGAHTISDVVSCPGTDSCKLGITSSMGLGRAVRGAVLENSSFIEDPLVRNLHIKISGCPNGCGQHHIANIGFHGAAMKAPSGEQIPAYELFLGGNYGGVSIDKTAIGQRIPRRKIPSKQVPRLLDMMLVYYQENRHGKEIFNEFVSRVGNEPFESMIDLCADIPSLNGDSQDVYMDWEKSIAYKLERGEGECSV